MFLVQLLAWLHVSNYRYFGTLKDDSLRINNSASSKCFTYRNVFQKWRQRFIKTGYPFLSKRLKILYNSAHTGLFNFHQHVVKSRPNTYQTMYGETLEIPMSPLAMITKYPSGKSTFCSKFAVKTLPCTVANLLMLTLKLYIVSPYIP